MHTICGFGREQSAIKDVKTPPLPALDRKSHTDCGMVPVMDVSCRVKAVMRVYVPTASGTVPVKLFECNCKNVRSGKTPMPLILPVNWLLFRSNCANDVKLKSWLVSEPVNWLKSKSIKMRLVKPPISVGMVDRSPPCSMPQTARFVKSPISVATVPTRLFSSAMEREQHGTMRYNKRSGGGPAL